MTDELDIPQSLRRQHTGEPAPEAETEIGLDQILATIKDLSKKREDITATISGLKKRAQKIVGSL
jgi:hypothetical protein